MTDAVLLVNPPYPALEEPLQENLGLGYLAAFLRKQDVEVAILDSVLSGLDVKETARRVSESGARLVGISVPYQDSFPHAASLVALLRETGFEGEIALGGIFPTVASQAILRDFPDIDFVVCGEGEETLFELFGQVTGHRRFAEVRGLTYREDGRVVANEARPLVADLDRLPDPARDTLDLAIARNGCISICTSRGCFGRCDFCSIYAFYERQPGHNYRARSAEHVVDEVERLTRGKSGAKIMFVDAEFIGPGQRGRERALAIAEDIIKRGLEIRFRIEARAGSVDREVFAALREAGLAYVFLGVESGVPEALERFHKDAAVEDNETAIAILKDLGIDMGIGFLMFDPYTTVEEVVANLDFLRRTGIPFSRLAATVSPDSKLIVFSGTPVERHLEEAGILKGDYLDHSYRIVDPSARAMQKCLAVAARVRRWGYRVEVATGLRSRPDLDF